MSRRLTRANASESSTIPVSHNTSNNITPSAIMYMNSQYNHPVLNKLYVGTTQSHGSKSYPTSTTSAPKAPKAPEKPLMPYMRYSRKVWDEVKASQPDLKLWEVGKIIGRMWRELPPTDKQVFLDEYDSEKIEYQEMLKAYHNSPAYQAYLQIKGRSEANDALESKIDREDAYLSIEPADDDSGDTDEGFSVKHIAAARFQRNHRLMQDILVECSVIPSGRGIVTVKRLETLRDQVKSLEQHQSKLQKELQQVENNHCLTKRKWKEQSSAFATEMKKLRAMSPQDYYQEYKKKLQPSKNESLSFSLSGSIEEQTLQDCNGKEAQKGDAKEPESKHMENNDGKCLESPDTSNMVDSTESIPESATIMSINNTESVICTDRELDSNVNTDDTIAVDGKLDELPLSATESYNKQPEKGVIESHDAHVDCTKES